MNNSPIHLLLNRVSARQQFASFGSRFYFFFLVAGSVYLLLFLASRALNIIPAWFDWTTLLVMPAVAIPLAFIFRKQPKPEETARVVDEAAKTDDLFLTAVQLDHAAGDYKPLVETAASQKALTLQPANIIGFNWQRNAAVLSAIAIVLAAAVLYLPQFDPFGREAEKQKLAQRLERLVESAQATEKRLEILKQLQEQGRTVEVKKQLDDLMKALNEMKPEQKKENLEKLLQEQKEVAKLWRELSEERLKNADDHRSAQKFSMKDSDRMKEWKEEMRRGQTDSVKRELQELKRKTEELSKKSEGLEKEKLAEELKQSLQNIADAMAEQPDSQQLSNAISRALEQLDTAQQEGMQQQAMEALKESLGLTEQELQQLAQNIGDQQSLEDALKMIQQAKRANDAGELDGDQFSGCEGMGDYAKAFKKMMGEGQGEKGGQPGEGAGGMGQNKGIGSGGSVEADENAKTDFKTEQANSIMQAGKIIMQWKSRGVSEAGQAREDFQKAVADVKQNLSEAILQEQVPPAYHEAIRKYFDNIEKSVEKPNEK